MAILPPYVFSGAYALKLALTGKGYETIGKPRAAKMLIVGAVATIYGYGSVYAGGP